MTLIVVLQVHYSSDGHQLYATASKDGAIKVQKLRVQNTIVKVSIELLESVSLHVKDLTCFTSDMGWNEQSLCKQFH